MTPEQIIERMRNGEQLRNFGSGWFIGKPHRPYTRNETLPVADETVGKLEADSLIKLRMLLRSIEGVLV